MKSKIPFLLSALMVLVSSQAKAQEMPAHGAQHVEEASGEAVAPIKVGNKTCPVSGQEVGSMGEGVEIEHNGKIYSLCCAGCVRDFNKDPDKYAQIADATVAQAEVEAEAEAEPEAAEDHSAHQH